MTVKKIGQKISKASHKRDLPAVFIRSLNQGFWHLVRILLHLAHDHCGTGAVGMGPLAAERAEAGA